MAEMWEAKTLGWCTVVLWTVLVGGESITSGGRTVQVAVVRIAISLAVM